MLEVREEVEAHPSLVLGQPVEELVHSQLVAVREVQARS